MVRLASVDWVTPRPRLTWRVSPPRGLQQAVLHRSIFNATKKRACPAEATFDVAGDEGIALQVSARRRSQNSQAAARGLVY